MNPYVDQPEVRPGDAGDAVAVLQAALQRLGLFQDPVDGEFGHSTEEAVRALASRAGEPGDEPGVTRRTWELLADQERAAGLGAALPVGALSEDHHWRWDGEQWQPNDDRTAALGTPVADPVGGQLSADGQWLWDGLQWRTVT